MDRTGNPTSASSRRRRVLVVEDDPSVAAIIKEFLLEVGCDVDLAYDPSAGLSAAATTRPGLVTVGLKMPTMDGVTFIRLLRGIDATIPVIVITGSTDAQAIDAAIAEGAVAWLAKPVRASEFREVVNSVFEGRR